MMEESKRVEQRRRWRRGFILSQQWQDIAAGCLLTFWGREESGPFELRFLTRPVCFVPRRCALPADAMALERRTLELRSSGGVEVDALYFRHERDLRATRAACMRAGVPLFESDVNPAARYLMERFVHGCCEFEGDSRARDGVAVYDAPRLRGGDWAPNLSNLAFDIETGSQGQLYTIGYSFNEGAKEERRVLAVGHGRARRDPPLQFLADEALLLRAFFDRVRELDPDLISGWNIVNFDLPFIASKCREHGVALALGRRGLEARLRENGGRWLVEAPGRLIADGIPLLRSLHLPLENYRLETVANAIVGEHKGIDFNGLDKQREIDRLFSVERVKLAAYCLQDAQLVSRIFERSDAVSHIIARSRITGLPAAATPPSMIAAFDTLFLPRLHRKGYVATDQDSESKAAEMAPGGLILTPQAGLHEDVVALDFRSLYPSLIRTFNICPYAAMVADEKAISTPTGDRFSATEHILPEMLRQLMERRAEALKEGNPILAQNIKLLMNSFYGIMGTGASRFYDPAIARAISGSGQWILREARNHVEACGYQVLYGDTDSLFALLPQHERHHPHIAGASLAASINAFFRERLQLDFRVKSLLEMRFERYYKRLYLPLARSARASAVVEDEESEGIGARVGAAKRYAGLVVRADGTEELQVVGMESVRSDWSALAHRIQREALRRLFGDEDIVEWLREEIIKLRTAPQRNELVYRRRIHRPLSSYAAAAPPHIQAARLLPAERQQGINIVEYVMTLRGAMPLELPHEDYDCDHYIYKQIGPAVEGLLELSGRSFTGVVSGAEQMRLF